MAGGVGVAEDESGVVEGGVGVVVFEDAGGVAALELDASGVGDTDVDGFEDAGDVAAGEDASGVVAVVGGGVVFEDEGGGAIAVDASGVVAGGVVGFEGAGVIVVEDASVCAAVVVLD